MRQYIITRVVKIIPYLYHVRYHLSKLAISGLFFQDPLSLNKSVLVLGFTDSHQ